MNSHVRGRRTVRPGGVEQRREVASAYGLLVELFGARTRRRICNALSLAACDKHLAAVECQTDHREQRHH